MMDSTHVVRGKLEQTYENMPGKMAGDGFAPNYHTTCCPHRNRFRGIKQGEIKSGYIQYGNYKNN